MKKLLYAAVAFCFCMATLTAFADTLELKNGSIIKGTFIGGSQAQLSFRVGSAVQHYPLADVAGLRFDSDYSQQSNNNNYAPPADSNYSPQSNYPSSQSNYPPPQNQSNYPQSQSNYPQQDQSNYPPPRSQSNYPASQDQSNYPPSQSNYPPPQNQSNYPPPQQDQPAPAQSNYPPQSTQQNYPQDSASAPPINGDSITVPRGTRLTVRMTDAVDSDHNGVGDRFLATLDQPLYVNDVLVAPRGSSVYGRLDQVQESGQLSGRAQLGLSLTRIVINGQAYPIVTGSYDAVGKSRGTSTAQKVGGGAALGAVIGAIAGGGKGAAIGAGVGAGAGTAVQVATKGDQVHVPSETILEFTIDQTVTLPISQ
ncbi:MAG TPA: DUF3824 domain-containing protein [Candidatus Angelobacter sp.]|nr:DUF3824 domain-containing protein [Candidatus Angelobacter sp.]